MHYTRGGIWKGDLLVEDIEELEKMDASAIHAMRLNAKEVLTPQNGETYIPDRRWNSQIIWRRPGSENIQSGTALTEEKSKVIFKENQTGFHHHFKTHRRMMVKQEMISGPFQASRGTLPREESFPLPLRYIDVTRATSTTLDVIH